MDFIYDPSLVLYLPLWQLDGSPFMSQDKHGHLCTVTGASWTLRGRLFDGSDDKIDIGSRSALQNFTAMTRLFWLKPTGFTGSSRGLLDGSYGAGTFGDMIIFEGAQDGISVFIKNTAGSVASVLFSYTADEWLQIGYSWDGANVTYYKNGQIDGSVDALTGTLACSARNLLLGDEGTRDNYGGEIGEYLTYNRGLNPLEFQRNYLATKWRYQ